MESFGVSYLIVVECTFFQSVFWVIAFGQDGFGFSPFYLMFKRIFLISVWLILSTNFKSYIRKPARTRNDQLENPKS